MSLNRRGLDRFEVCDELGITRREFAQLERNPSFPSPSHESRFTVLWAATDIARFKERLDACRRRGWKGPDCFYPWEVNWPLPWRFRFTADRARSTRNDVSRGGVD